MRQIPYGIINFKRIIENNYLYVDKTKFIEKLEQTPDLSTSFYLRPGRFGKSLFTSMLSYYYGVEYKDEFETLFSNLYIGKNPTPNRNKYYVMNLDFSGMDIDSTTSLDNIRNIFGIKVETGIQEFINRYNLQIQIMNKEYPAFMLKQFFVEFKKQKPQEKIYIIIDEYDNFTNGILKGNAEKFLQTVSGEGFVKAFYAVIKEEIKVGTVERFFATGIAPITLDSMTTGFNIATDVTRRKGFLAMCGFTHKEVKEIIREVLPEKTTVEQDKIYEKMKQYYDGYRFSENTEETVFNSTLVMYYLKEYLENGEDPEQKLDVNIAANFEKLGSLITLKNNEYSKEILECLMQKREITGKITGKFNLDMSLTRNDIMSILYYFGYATIDQKLLQGVSMRIPNYVMKEIYNDYFMFLLEQEGLHIDTEKMDEAVRQLALEGSIEKICKLVEEYLSYVGNIAWQKYDEKYVKGYMHSIMVTTNIFNTYLEFNVKNNGYIDVAIFKNKEGVKYQAIIEVKYLKKEDGKRKNIANKKEEALEQIEKYMQDERLPKDNLKKFIVIFVGQKLELLQEV